MRFAPLDPIRATMLRAVLPGLTVVALACLGAASKPATPSPAAEPVIAQSTFILPASPQEGRDPFYPRSLRPYAAAALLHTNATQTAVTPIVALELRLNGISGTAGRPLAIINN